jgi:hypothetical protein
VDAGAAANQAPVGALGGVPCARRGYHAKGAETVRPSLRSNCTTSSVTATAVTARAGRRSRSFAEVLTPRLENQGLLLADAGGHPVELRPSEAAALLEADRIEPERG